MSDPNDPSELSRQMAEAVDHLHPEPPPFANLTAARRRRNRQWMTAGGAITVVVLVIAGLAVAGVGRGGGQRVQVGPAGPVAAPTSTNPSTSAPATAPANVSPSITTPAGSSTSPATSPTAAAATTLPPTTFPVTTLPVTTLPVTTLPPTTVPARTAQTIPLTTAPPVTSLPRPHLTGPSSHHVTSPPPGSPPLVGANAFQTRAPSNATFVGGSFYVAWQSQTSSTTVAELGLVDPTTGRIEAMTVPDPPLFSFGVPIETGGSLWVTAGSLQGEDLLRLNPQTLQTTGQWLLAQGGPRSYWNNDLVAAGGWLWVADGPRLLRVSPQSGAVTLTVTLPAGSGSNPSEATSNVATDPAGSILLDGEANSGGAGAIERRDPKTGQLLASHALNGVSAPKIGGISGSTVWVSEATGMLGTVEHFDARTLTGAAVSGFSGTNGIAVRVAENLVWVTDPVSQADSNTCSNPTTGQVLDTIPLPQPASDEVLTIGPSAVYYVSDSAAGTSALRSLPIPAACHL